MKRVDGLEQRLKDKKEDPSSAKEGDSTTTIEEENEADSGTADSEREAKPAPPPKLDTAKAIETNQAPAIYSPTTAR